MKRFLLYLVLLLLSLPMRGQGVVEGVVTDSATGLPMEFVNVGVAGSKTVAVTDSRGNYRLQLPTPDSVTLRYSFTGYLSAVRRVAVPQGKLRLNVALAQDSKQLQTVQITDEKTRESAFTQIDIERLDDAVGPAGGVEGLIKMLPDVQSNNELSSHYSVRGGSFDENLVYINGVEVSRPMLIRSGQQEGMSIINPDLVDYILFSPGGFDVTYGDKLSSALDITYLRPQRFKGKFGMSLLGATATVQGRVRDRLSYAIGLRHHSNNYVLGSLDTKGSYTSRYSDLQALLGYRVNSRLDLGFMAVCTRNIYGLVPESQTTTFGNALMGGMEIDIYFDGQEQDRYTTLLGAFTADWRPSSDWRLRSHLSVQRIDEGERYDVQSQYWLYQISQNESADDTAHFDRGVGTFLEHARNRLSTRIVALDIKADRYARLGSWNFGLKLQMEDISDHLREWKWVDSAGYAIPSHILPIGDPSNVPLSPILQQFAVSDNVMRTFRAASFAQRELNIHTRRGSDFRFLVGVRGQLYGGDADDGDTAFSFGPRWLLSPRVSASFRPAGKNDILFRLAAGLYRQAPFYREYRCLDGSLMPSVAPQTSYQVTGTADWRFRLWDKPFSLTADLYYKYLTDLIPYTIDNLRLRYMPDKSAVGYATGLSLRLNAELIEGLESWASLSLMRTCEDILGDSLGWLSRPTDQRVSFKLFLQDNVPDMPWWRMSLNLVYATGTPVTPPSGEWSNELRLPSYYRIDWGNTIRLSQFKRLRHAKVFRMVDDIQVGLDVFNLFNFRNVVSYLWVMDTYNFPRRVPNYLTARQVNIKLTILF